MLTKIKNQTIAGWNGRPMATDIFYKDNGAEKPVLIYAHGFNGFKDWGNFDVIGDQFAAAGFVFIKFNFSHNGTTPDEPETFTDLEAFGHNNYTIELYDLDAIINWVCDVSNPYAHAMNTSNINVVGHSMGGGIAIIKAAEDSRIKKLITWASICECKTPWGNWNKEKMAEWESDGVAYYINGRTKQQMPMYYQLYQDFLVNEPRLNLQQAMSKLSIPVLICHGTQDAAVPIAAGHALASWFPPAQFFTVESDHVFGRSHPWPYTYLPPPMQDIVDHSIAFLSVNP